MEGAIKLEISKNFKIINGSIKYNRNSNNGGGIFIG